MEDLQQFRLQLLQDLQHFFENRAEPSPKKWLKSSEVRKLLGVSHGTLQNLRVKGTLPYKKIGGMMFYKLTDIEKLLE